MALRLLFVLTVLVVFGVAFSSDPNRAQKDCLHLKYRTSFGPKYDECINRKQATEIVEMKQCYQDFMKDERVVKVKSGQMTVDRNKFKEYAEANSNKPVGQAMKKCHAGANAQDDMWKEAARASQCVFLKMKETC